MELSNKVRELIYSMFDTMVEGVDKYETKSSTWLIFTDEKKWVLEFTKENILWFNYNIFQSELVLVGMDCVDSKDVIKEWFESRFLGIDVVEETLSDAGKPLKVEDTIQNGVKHTLIKLFSESQTVEDTIQNGVKLTSGGRNYGPYSVEETIQNGVKDITYRRFVTVDVEDTIQNGVKRTQHQAMLFPERVEDTIQNGVKRTSRSPCLSDCLVEDTIQNGVKHTNCKFQFTLQGINDAIENGANDTDPETYQINSMVEDTIQNGVKS